MAARTSLILRLDAPQAEEDDDEIPARRRCATIRVTLHRLRWLSAFHGDLVLPLLFQFHDEQKLKVFTFDLVRNVPYDPESQQLPTLVIPKNNPRLMKQAAKPGNKQLRLLESFMRNVIQHLLPVIHSRYKGQRYILGVLQTENHQVCCIADSSSKTFELFDSNGASFPQESWSPVVRSLQTAVEIIMQKNLAFMQSSEFFNVVDPGARGGCALYTTAFWENRILRNRTWAQVIEMFRNEKARPRYGVDGLLRSAQQIVTTSYSARVKRRRRCKRGSLRR